jgi:hypothetical protein
MRNLFFALVLANLAFAAWSAWYAAAPPATAVSAQSAVPIRLVSEVAREKPEGARAPGVGSDERGGEQAPSVGSNEPGGTLPSQLASPDPDRCVSVGPFADLDDAEAAASRLRALDYAAAPRAADGDVWIGYWVHIDAIPSRVEANRALADLRENGVADAYLIPGEADGDIISLGVFSDIGRAGRLRERARELGLDALVVDRSRRGTVYWIDMELPGSHELDLEGLQAPGRITRLEQRSCETTAD